MPQFDASRGRGALCIAAAIGALFSIACEPTNKGYSPNQPIVYSHAVHAGGLKIPCQYCHYAAERGRHAGIPAAQICMNCHSQVVKDHPEIAKVKESLKAGRPIEWVRIHRMPDFVYFDHSAHVNKGVACQTCHGSVETMGRVTQESPLTMGWCVECHRKSWPKAVERAAVAALNMPKDEAFPPGTAPMTRANRLTDCAVCHH